jgi:hypothetical protein
MIGVHNFRENARLQLVQRGIEVPPGADVMSVYQRMLMMEGRHNFQVHARNELTRRGIDVPPPGENVLSLYQRIRMMANNQN